MLIADLTGSRPPTGWISSQLSAVADVLIDVEKLIKSLIVLAHVIHVDETTSNINGARSASAITGSPPDGAFAG
jgi:transposase